MTVRQDFVFSNDRSRAIDAVSATAGGRGWCNVRREVVDDVPALKVNFFGLWAQRGVAVASFVTSLPRQGVPQPSTMGFLHSRGRLGASRVKELLDGAPYIVRQDHNQRGLLLDVPVDEPAERIIDVMCALTDDLCDYESTGNWLLTQFLNE